MQSEAAHRTLPAESARPSTKASIAVAAELRDQIARGELVVGQALPVESVLMAEIGVSKGVMREALRILEQQGLIEVRRGAGGGPRVRHPSIAEASLPFGTFLQVAEVPVGDVVRSRDRLVGAAIERVATHHTDDDLEALDAVVERLVAVTGDFDTYTGELLDAGETVVGLAGSRTDAALVAALRHVMATELESKTHETLWNGTNFGLVTAAEEFVTSAWADVVDHIRRGDPRQARRAYDRQAELILSGGFGDRLVAETVLGALAEPARLGELPREHS